MALGFYQVNELVKIKYSFDSEKVGFYFFLLLFVLVFQKLNRGTLRSSFLVYFLFLIAGLKDLFL